ncbi:MAG: glycosyltransferase family 4 protein [Jatrophihabitantaceae bacterium]
MRIAHVTDCYLPRMGGIERQVEGLTRAQAAVGHQVEVITSVPVDRFDSDAPNVPVLRPAQRPGSHPGSIRYQAAWAGRRAVLDGDYDLVHLHASTFSPLAYLAAGASSQAGIPTVVTLHSLWSWATPIFRGFDLALDWRRWPITWTAVSEMAAQSLTGVLRAGTQISVLPNGVRPQQWQCPRPDRRPDRVVLVSVMRLAARKRPMQLLKMLRAVREQVPAEIGIEVKIIGDGPKREQLLSYLRRHQMADWVQLTGQLDQPTIRQVFADADVYLSPATLESFGIAALEARCAGLPVVAFAGTGVSDFIRHADNGLLVADDAEMTDAITSLVRSPEVRAALTARNLATESGFSWASVLDTCDSVYASAFAQQGRSLPARPQPLTTSPAG